MHKLYVLVFVYIVDNNITGKKKEEKNAEGSKILGILTYYILPLHHKVLDIVLKKYINYSISICIQNLYNIFNISVCVCVL